MHVRHEDVGALRSRKLAPFVGRFDRPAVADMVLAHHDEAVGCEEAGDIVVTVDELDHAVYDLDDAAPLNARSRLPGQAEQLVYAIGRGHMVLGLGALRVGEALGPDGNASVSKPSRTLH